MCRGGSALIVRESNLRAAGQATSSGMALQAGAQSHRRSKVQDQLMDFSNRTGNELSRLLAQRALEELCEQSDFDRLTAMLGAALIAVAEVLREQIEKGSDVSKLVDLSSRWLRVLLEPVEDKGAK